MPHFVYIAKNDNEDFAVNTRGRGTKTPSGAVGIPGGFIIHNRKPECDRLENSLSRDEKEAIAEALIDLAAACEKLRVVLNQAVVFMIHFGGQDPDTCRAFTRRMNEAAAEKDEISQHRFIAVSRYNNCPEGFFEEGRLLPPDAGTINGVLAQWAQSASEIPMYDHLRGMLLLCQAFRAMSKEQREDKSAWVPGSDWWRSNLWGKAKPIDMRHAFSEAEVRILERNETLYDFCSALLNEPFNLKKYDDDKLLKTIVALRRFSNHLYAVDMLV